MQTDNKLLDDLAKVATSAAGTMLEARKQIEALVQQNMERFMANMDMVPREEFEVVKEMAAKARAEQEKLEKRIKVLESKAKPVTKSKTKKTKKS